MFEVMWTSDHRQQKYELASTPVYFRSPMKRRVAIIFTGGTIASTLDQDFGGIVPSLTGGEILSKLPGIDAVAECIVHEFGTYPGPHITPDLMLEIAAVARSYVDRSDIDGVVVTHGTDTLEETAYLMDVTVATEKPIVVVGSMRNSSEPDWDGPRNLRDAITVASHDAPRGMGTLVVLGGEIHAASEVTKTDTEEIDTFASPNFGPLGRLTNQHVLIHREPVHRETFFVEHLPSFVPILKSYAGMDGRFVDFAVEQGASGLVIEAFGVGNVTPPVFHALRRALEKNIPVVLVSRCLVGRVEHLYAYEGAGKQLHKEGVIFADYMNGPKARIKLMCAIAAGLDIDSIRACFEWVDEEALT
jgi:L-asparaginase